MDAATLAALLALFGLALIIAPNLCAVMNERKRS